MHSQRSLAMSVKVPHHVAQDVFAAERLLVSAAPLRIGTFACHRVEQLRCKL